MSPSSSHRIELKGHLRWLLPAAMILGLLLLAQRLLRPDSTRESSHFSDIPAPAPGDPTPPSLEDEPRGEKLYVPVYSSVHHREGQEALLATTLSVRNTSETGSISLRRVDYYDSQGEKVTSYLEQPIVVGPLVTRSFFVEYRDARGGMGANFIVEWSSAEGVTAPLVETIMVGNLGATGVSLVGHAVPITTRTPASDPSPEPAAAP